MSRKEICEKAFPGVKFSALPETGIEMPESRTPEADVQTLSGVAVAEAATVNA